MTDKTYRFAGVSRREGELKARFANDQMRIKVLAKTGSTDIDLIELKNPMTKADAVEFLLSINFDNGNAEVRAALEADLDKRQPTTAGSKDKPKKEAKKPAKEKAPKALSLDAISARAARQEKPAEVFERLSAELDDAPF